MGLRRKKKTTVSLNGSPLQAITIGEIKQSKYGWVGTIVLIVFFALLIYMLPTINDWYLEFKGSSVPPMTGIGGNNTEDPGNKSDTPKNIVKYAINDSPTIEVADLNFNGFTYLDGEFTYSIINNFTEKVAIEEKNLFLEFYDSIGTLLKRVYITGNVSAEGSTDFTIYIPVDTSEFAVVEYLEEEFTYFDMILDENQVGVLTCSKNEDTVEYTFKNDELIKIKHNLRYYRIESDYDDTYAHYSNLIDDYEDIEGITSSLESNIEYLTYEIEIDYDVYAQKLDSIEYFARKSNPREVSFKMEAMEYNCK